ncbi:hypothetical protein VitviT2T_003850 [Vitis vinifera]|uniref:Uncharacterized protein n=1 Tax=Vitis vinifera TaxID=29760 RepID=A0ABY9BPB9_VITVI|nr:hypothetical protein VitviT2T_003850 [Vitis vinifera]
MKLDGVRSFERTVVLLLRSGTRHPQEGPFGVVINRALHKTIKHMKPINLELATTFAECSLHFGGPLEASMFLLKTGVLTCDPSIYPRALHVRYCNYIRTLRANLGRPPNALPDGEKASISSHFCWSSRQG